MNVNEIINSLELYIEEYKFDFYIKTLSKLKKITFSTIFKIQEDEYLLESIRINLNLKKYDIYLSNKKNETCYRRLDLSENQIKNLLIQIFAIEIQDFMALCFEETNNFVNNFIDKLKKKNGKFKLYILISKMLLKDTLHKCKENYGISGIVLGIDSLRLLEHQNMNRLCKMMLSNNKEISEPMEVMKTYWATLQKLGWKEKERILIFSGVALQVLGTTYTKDVDIMIIANNKDKKYFDFIQNLFKNQNIDFHILLNDNNWHKNKNQVLLYQKKWFTYLLPKLSGADDIFEMISNPKHFFFFMSMKFISLESILQRARVKSFPETFTDLIMLKKINNLKVNPLPCIPNMIINQGKITIYNQENINRLYFRIQKFLKLWYETSMTINEIKKEIPRCGNVYSLKNCIIEDEDTEDFKIFLKNSKSFIIKNNCQFHSKILWCGLIDQFESEFLKYLDIKNILVLDPNKYMIEQIDSQNNLIKQKIQGDLNYVWKNNYKYDELVENTFDCIIINLNQVIKEIDNFVNNINLVSKKDTKLIIFCLDSNLVYNNLLERDGKIEVRNFQEPLFGIYNLDKLDNKINIIHKILIYLKGECLENGSIEYILDEEFLNKKLIDINFAKKDKMKFSDLNINDKNNLGNLEEISKYFICLIYQKI